MADTSVAITQGSGTNIDTQTPSGGDHRQVVVIGDPGTVAGVAPVDVTSGLKVNLGADNDVQISDGTDTLLIDGNGSAQVILANTAGALFDPIGPSTPKTFLDVDETEEDVKTTAGTLYWVHAVNLSATKKYLKFYNATAANTTVGTTTPLMTFVIPTLGDTNGAGFAMSFGAGGAAFSTALCIAATTGLADADTGAPGANEVVVTLGYV